MSVSSEDMADSVLPLMFQNADKDIFTRLNMGVIYLDEHGSVFSSNEVVKHMTGFTAEELMVKGSDDFDLSTNNEINQLCEFICSTKNLYEQENNRTFKVTDIKGNLKYLSCDLFPLHDNCTNYSGKLCILKDDTIRTVCANEHSFDKDDLKASHLPFVSFLWKCDDGWSVEYVSDNIVQFGYSPDEFISGMLSYADIVHPDYLDFVKEEVEKCQGSHFSKEYLIMTADGDERWILERSYAVRDSNNSITHFHGAILDISARKESERELESMNRYAKALSRLGEKSLLCNDINELMNYAVNLISEALNIKYSLIMEMLADGNFLLRYGHGFSEWCIGSALVGGDMASLSGYTAFTGVPLVVEDIRTEERFSVPRFLYEHKIVSSATVIIGNRNDMYGVLGVHADKQRKFTERDINFLQSVANILTESIKLRDSFKSLELYRNLINRSGDLIMVLNAVTKKFIYVSDRIFNDLGYSESEILAQNVFDPGCFITGHDMREIIPQVAREGLLVVESELVRKDGSSFSAEISFAFVENEGTSYIVLVGRDITEKKKAAMVLRESETKMRAIFNNASDLICLFDTEGRILEVNRIMEDQLCMQEYELKCLNVKDILDPAVHSQVSGYIVRVMEKGIVTVELDVLKKNGTRIPMETRIQLIELNGKKRLLAIGRDISERRKLEQAMKEHARQLEYSNEVKGLFADITSHDLTGSVSIIEGFASHLAEIETDEEKKHLLINVVNTTDKLKKTIDSASVFAKLNCASDLTIEILDLRLIYYSALERLLSKVTANGINVKLASPQQCDAVANPIIEEVFYNLLSNAIKYSPQGGQINVDILLEGNKWMISVSDEGPGISDEDKLKIFERFKRADSSVSGQGLGLAITRMALECHGEDIYVSDNDAGTGSKFCFTVKAAGRPESQL